MAAIRKESIEQFRVAFAELANLRRGDFLQVDPFLLARAISAVMRECSVRSASGRPILWNEYRVVLARADFELVRSLQEALDRDLTRVLTQEAKSRDAELVGALRVTVVFDESNELAAGQGVIRVGFVPTERLPPPRAGEMTVRIDARVVAGEIAARAAVGPSDTQFVDDSAGVSGERHLLTWPTGQVRLQRGLMVLIGRPHPEAPPGFVGLTGASAKVNKQHLWLVLGASTVRVGRFANANPVAVNGQAIGPGQEIEAALPAEISLSRGELVLTVQRR